MRRSLLGAIIPASFLIIWEVSSRTGLLTLESLSRPSDIVAAGLGALLDGSLLLATLQTCVGLYGWLKTFTEYGSPAGVGRSAEVNGPFSVMPRRRP